MHKIFRYYLRWFCLVLLVSLSMAAIFNGLVDPFDLFASPSWDGVNQFKTEAHKYSRLTKAHKIIDYPAKGLIIGNSRAETALDPQHPSWQGIAVYNLALSGGSVYEARRYLEFASTLHKLDKVVLVADSFDDRPQRVDIGFEEGRLQPYWGVGYRIADQIRALFSFSAVDASWQTIKSQTLDYPGIFHRTDGLRDDRYQSLYIRTHGGQRSVFRQSVIPSPATLKALAAVTQSVRATARSLDGRHATLADIREIIELCQQQGIALYIVISPLHAWFQETMRIRCQWPDFEDWKRELTHTVEAELAQGGSSVALWDFSGYNSLTTEAVPPAGDSITLMRWYLEASHYRRAVGDLILDRILDSASPARPLPTDFGVRLTVANIESHLADIRAMQSQWQQQHPQDVAEILSLQQGIKSLCNDLGQPLVVYRPEPSPAGSQ